MCKEEAEEWFQFLLGGFLGRVLPAVFAITAVGYVEGHEELAVREYELDCDTAEGDRPPRQRAFALSAIFLLCTQLSEIKTD